VTWRRRLKDDCALSSYLRVHHRGLNATGGRAAQAIGLAPGWADDEGSMRWWTDRAARSNCGSALGRWPTWLWRPRWLLVCWEADAELWSPTKVTTPIALRVLLVEKQIFPCPAINATRKENRSFHRGYYRKRHQAENFFAALTRQRRAATRYENLATSFAAFVPLGAILNWIS
jgi:transposase